MIIEPIFNDAIENLKSSKFSHIHLGKNSLRTGNIIAFESTKRYANSYNGFDDSINFLMEIPDIDAFGAICFSKLLTTQIGYLLSSLLLKETESISISDGNIILQTEDKIVTEENTEIDRFLISITDIRKVTNAYIIHISIDNNEEAKTILMISNL